MLGIRQKDKSYDIRRFTLALQFIVVALFVAAASAASLTPDSEAVIVQQDLDNIGVGGYKYE